MRSSIARACPLLVALFLACGGEPLDAEVSVADDEDHAITVLALSNCDFESGLTGWQQVEPVTTSSVARGGDLSAKLSASTGRLRRTVSGLTGGTRYTFSAYVLGSVRLAVRDHGAAEVALTKTASSWSKASVTFTTGSSSTSAELELSWAGGGDARVDDARLAIVPVDLTPSAGGVVASTSDANVAARAVDGSLGTRWSGLGDGAWLRVDLGAVRTVTNVKVAVYQGAARRNLFDLETSTDGASWTRVWSGRSSGTTAERETYDIDDVRARYVRYVGHGYSSASGGGMWSSVTELAVFGDPAGATSTPASPSCSHPAQVLDLSTWKETLPIGSPTEISQPALATYAMAPWFRTAPGCDGVVFRAHTSGATTSGSGYPRSELREMTSGGAKASWSTTSGTHRMFIDQAITAVPRGKRHVVAGQIHDGEDDVIVIRLEHPKLFIDINGATGPTLDPSYTLGKRFTIEMVARNGTIAIHYNGNDTPAYVLHKSASGCYFKAGAYTQSNCSTEEDRGEDCGTDNFGEVTIHDLWVRHE